SGDIMPAHIVDLNDWQVDEWPSTPEGEERQAKEIEQMYRRLFAHPLVEAITTWDFKDGAWLKAPSGFLRLDLTEKPSYTMLKKLVGEEWHTDLSLTTDAEGFVLVDAFKGDYKITSDKGSANISLTDDKETVVRL
ncbi:MAG: 1,4-beta-xylanase, partial [Lachnospiraceae bacterium]|nr:1,4-beta-xylanase [Lachnospiraceae bacterium]